MKLKQQTRLSILVIVVAALLLEANTALEFFSARRSFTEQLTEKAQRDLNESNRIARVKQEVQGLIKDKGECGHTLLPSPLSVFLMLSTH